MEWLGVQGGVGYSFVLAGPIKNPQLCSLLVVQAMKEVAGVLSAMEREGSQAAAELLPVVYEELRRLAHQLLEKEKPGQTLQATGLVHEAYIRLVGNQDPGWNGQGHFFAAAAASMRRILINRARDRGRLKRGGGRLRVELDNCTVPFDTPSEVLLDLNDELDRLAAAYPRCASLVEMRFFAGMSLDEAAIALGISRRTAEREWVFARAWLRDSLDAS